MSCCRPFLKYNKYSWRFDSIPCGWCISCRIDKRMYYKTRLEYDLYKKKKGSGAFVCLTYDDEHIPLNSFGDCTLRKQDTVKFLKRLRSYLSYHDLYDGVLLQKDWKYVSVGEYGDDGRAHYHFIFTGLDYAAVEPYLRKCWKKAIIVDSRPILDGGINYVLKYIDKQQHGDQLEEQYYDLDKEPPFMNISHNFGWDVYKNGFDSENLTFKYGAKNIPLPPYVKKRLCLQKPRREAIKICEFALKNRMSYDEANRYLVEVKEHALEVQMRIDGLPVIPADFIGEFNSTLNFARLRRKGVF